jgi:uncharacterized membrane protein YdjX (TVP38/TMEM64 family)
MGLKASLAGYGLVMGVLLTVLGIVGGLKALFLL